MLSGELGIFFRIKFTKQQIQKPALELYVDNTFIEIITKAEPKSKFGLFWRP